MPSDGDTPQLNFPFDDDSAAVLEGGLFGLSDDDLTRFKDGTYGKEQVSSFFETGEGLHDPEGVLFAPKVIRYPVAGDAVTRELVKILAPPPRLRVGVLSSIDYSNPIEHRLAVFSALGCSDDQTALIEWNISIRMRILRLSGFKVKVLQRHVDVVEGLRNLVVALDGDNNGAQGNGGGDEIPGNGVQVFDV